jgi:hypothetical protein
MVTSTAAGVFVVRYEDPSSLAPERQRELETALRAASGAVGIVFVVGPAVPMVGHEVPEYWIGITSDPRLQIAAIAVVSRNPAISVATRAFSTANILRSTAVSVKPFQEEQAAIDWVAAEVGAARARPPGAR